MRASIEAYLAAFLFSSMAIGLVACPDPERPAGPSSPASQAKEAARPDVGAPGAEDPSTVVAIIGEEEVTLGELDEELASELHQAKMEHRRNVYEMRRGGIDRIIAKRLFSEEAERMGLEDEEAFIREAVEKGTPYPSEEEARAFFQQNEQMMGGQDFEAMQGRVTQFLHQRKKQERFNEILSGLREKADVKILLSEPRVDVEAKGPSKGPEDAPVTIVEFSDFLCPFCARGKEAMDEIQETYGDKVRFVFRLFPTLENEEAVRTAEAAVCADMQGFFWQMHEALFSAGRAFSDEDIVGYAGSIEGLDVDAFNKCLEDDATKERIMKDIAAGRSVGVGGTPAFFINGIPVLGAQPFKTFKEIIDSELREDEEPSTVAVDD